MVYSNLEESRLYRFVAVFAANHFAKTHSEPEALSATRPKESVTTTLHASVEVLTNRL